MRNKMIHNYFEVNIHIYVFGTVKPDLPPLKRYFY